MAFLGKFLTEYLVWETLHLKGAVPVLDALLERALERAESHGLRHGDMLIQKGHVVINALQDTRSCWPHNYHASRSCWNTLFSFQ